MKLDEIQFTRCNGRAECFDTLANQAEIWYSFEKDSEKKHILFDIDSMLPIYMRILIQAGTLSQHIHTKKLFSNINTYM